MSKNNFNFFQYSYTGSLENSGYNVAPFVNGLFTGFYTPSDLLSSLTGYIFNIFSEEFLTPPVYNIQLQGLQNSSNKDNPSISLNFNGSFIPFVKESGNFNVSFNGGQSGQLKDIPNFFVSISGDQFGQLKDIPNFTIQVSGNYGETMSDRPNFNFYFNAIQSGQLKDIPNFFLVFTGGFQKPVKDFAYTNFSGSGITWTVGNTLNVFNFNDNVNTSFQPLRITWNPTA